jgi:hypothetical protein
MMGDGGIVVEMAMVVVKMEMAMMIMEGRRKSIEIEKNVAFEMRYR